MGIKYLKHFKNEIEGLPKAKKFIHLSYRREMESMFLYFYSPIFITDGRFLDMMTQTFPDNLALITSAYELAFSFCMMVGFELGGCLYEKFEFWVPLNVTSK